MMWADEHTDALQALANQTIRVAAGLDERLGWALPAGWVHIVNRLHLAVVELIGDYEIIRAGSKGGDLRYAIDCPAQIDDSDASWHTSGGLVVEATHESWTVCDLCGEPVPGHLVTLASGNNLDRLLMLIEVSVSGFTGLNQSDHQRCPASVAAAQNKLFP